MQTLQKAGARLVELLKQEPTLTDLDIDQQNGGAEHGIGSLETSRRGQPFTAGRRAQPDATAGV